MINPDQKSDEKKREGDESHEYTDGFYTSESDELPLEATNSKS